MVAALVVLFLASVRADAQDTRTRDAYGAPPTTYTAPPTSPPATLPPATDPMAQARYLPPGTVPPVGAYKLGVYSRNTDVGVQLTQVQPGSAAQRAGLEPNDIIVNVAGYQVGVVGGRTFDIGEELSKRVDGRGQVSLLVRNSRNGQLLNLPVQFTAANWSVSGSISTRERVTISQAGYLSVRLLDVTSASWSDVAIAESNLGYPRVWPVNYRLDVDPALLRSGHKYAVDARLMDRGQVMLRTASPSYVTPTTGTAAVTNLQLVPVPRPTTTTTTTATSTLAPSSQISAWYQKYLGRMPSPREISAWEYELQRGRTMTDVQAGLLSSSEYFERAYNDLDRYVDAVYSHLYDAVPTPEIHRAMRTELDRMSQVRYQFAQDLIARRFGTASAAGVVER